MFKGYLGVFVLLVGFMSCSSKKEEKITVPEIVANEYPDLVLTFQNGDRASAKNLEGNNVFVLFHPECDHCQAEAIEIEQRLNGFKDYTLYFISSSPLPQILKFAEDFRLDNKENVKFAWTSTEGVLTYYGAIPTPSVYIYSKGKLVKAFNGQTSIENILNSL